MKKITLSKKIQRLFLMSMSFCILCMGVGIFYKAKGQLQKEIISKVDVVSNSTQQTIDSFLKSIEMLVNSIVNEPNLGQTINLLDVEGTDNESVKNIEKYLGNIVKENKEIVSINIGTEKGKYLMYPRKEVALNYSPKATKWYQSTVKEQKLNWTKPYSTSRGTLMTVSSPILVNKTIVGVISIDLDFKTIVDKTKEFNIGDNNIFGIVLNDGEETIFQHISDEKLAKEYVGKAITDEELAMSGKVYLPEFSKLLKEDIEKDNGIDKEQAPKENKETLEKVKLGGKSYYTNIIKSEQRGWDLFVAVGEREFNASTMVLLSTSVIIGVITLFLSSLIVKRVVQAVSGSLKKITEVVKVVESGDLTIRCGEEILKLEDEIGMLAKGLNSLIENQSNLIGNIKSAARILGESSHNLNSSAQETTAILEEIGASLDGITKETSNQTSNTEECLELAERNTESLNSLSLVSDEMARSSVELSNKNNQGLNVVNKLKISNDKTNETEVRVEKKIEELNEKSSDIHSIVDTIVKIAEQIDMLSLNAAIEAARAGEHGRGFAVVADEVKKLASLSSDAANEIEEIVSVIRNELLESLKVLAELKNISKENTDSVNEVFEAFEIISLSNMKIGEIIENVATGVEGISVDTVSIVDSIKNAAINSTEISNSTNQVSGSVDQQQGAMQTLLKTSTSLNELAIELNEAVDKFKIE